VIVQQGIPFVSSLKVASGKLHEIKARRDALHSSSTSNASPPSGIQRQPVKASEKNVPCRKSDIFLEPFEEGICIKDNLTRTHRLLFNKYPGREYHVLIVTKEREA
jgi:ATP adenylyltransferase/5',5'''-P-1,P-4-tetraphosphate phosphorylase II